MVTNDIKKGMRFMLRDGWYATMMDNRRGNIRMAEVEGYFKETGSVYATDIVLVETPNGWEHVQHPKSTNNNLAHYWR